MDELIKDSSGRILGFIRTTPNGRQKAYDVDSQYHGYYDAEHHLTKDLSGAGKRMRHCRAVSSRGLPRSAKMKRILFPIAAAVAVSGLIAGARGDEAGVCANGKCEAAPTIQPSIIHAEEHQWWRATPAQCENGLCFGIGLPCKIADHSPAKEYEDYSYLGAKIVDHENGLLAINIPKEAFNLAVAGGFAKDIIGYFFRSKIDCENYIRSQQDEQQNEQKQYQKSLDPYR